MPDDDLYIYQMDLIFRFWKTDIWLKVRDLFHLQATTRNEGGAAEWKLQSLSPGEMEFARHAIDDQKKVPENVQNKRNKTLRGSHTMPHV